MFNLIQRLDTAIFDWVQAHQNAYLAYAARDLTSLGGDTLVVLVTVFVAGLLWTSGRKGQALRFVVTMIVTASLIVVLKLLVGRPCPLQPDPYQHYMGMGGTFPLAVLHLPCMPSGHTCASTVLYGLIGRLAMWPWSLGTPWRWARWASCWSLSLPITIGLTRIYLSAHWASDVVAGYALGWCIVLVWQWVEDRL